MALLTGIGKNDNGTIDEAAVFLGGRLTSKIGAFVEGTYDGVENIGVLDNTDIRFADHSQVVAEADLWFDRQ